MEMPQRELAARAQRRGPSEVTGLAGAAAPRVLGRARPCAFCGGCSALELSACGSVRRSTHAGSTVTRSRPSVAAPPTVRSVSTRGYVPCLFTGWHAGCQLLRRASANDARAPSRTSRSVIQLRAEMLGRVRRSACRSRSRPYSVTSGCATTEAFANSAPLGAGCSLPGRRCCRRAYMELVGRSPACVC